MCSGQVEASHLGHFYNSFHLTNYDWNLRTEEPDKTSDAEEGDEPKDERLKRKSKLIDNFAVHHESEFGDDFSRA